MAVASTDSDIVTGGSPLAFSITVSGPNPYVVVAVSNDTGGGPDPDAASVTIDGNAMSVKHTDITTSADANIRIFERVGVATGTISGSVSWSGGGHMRAAIVSYSGVDQATPSDAVNTYDGTGGSTSTSHTISTASGNYVVAFMVTNPGITGLAATGGATIAISDLTDTGAGNQSTVIAHILADASSETIGVSWNETTGPVGWAFDINAAAGGGNDLGASLGEPVIGSSVF